MNLKNMALAVILALSPILGQADDVTRLSPTVKAVSQVMPSVVNIATKTGFTELGISTIGGGTTGPRTHSSCRPRKAPGRV